MIEPQLTEMQYWRIAQAVSAAGTASHRHGMERHAESFHKAEKALFRAYEQSAGSDEIQLSVTVYRNGEAIEQLDATTGTIQSLTEEILSSHPEYQINVKQKD